MADAAGEEIHLILSAFQERLEALESRVEEKAEGMGAQDAKFAQLASDSPGGKGANEDMASFVKATAKTACEGWMFELS